MLPRCLPDEHVMEGELDDVIGGGDEAPEAVEERHPRLGQDVEDGELVAEGELRGVAGREDDPRAVGQRDVGPVVALLQRQEESVRLQPNAGQKTLTYRELHTKGSFQAE